METSEGRRTGQEKDELKITQKSIFLPGAFTPVEFVFTAFDTSSPLLGTTMLSEELFERRQREVTLYVLRDPGHQGQALVPPAQTAPNQDDWTA